MTSMLTGQMKAKSSNEGIGYKSSGHAAFYKEHEKYGVSLDGCAGSYSTYD